MQLTKLSISIIFLGTTLVTGIIVPRAYSQYTENCSPCQEDCDSYKENCDTYRED